MMRSSPRRCKNTVDARIHMSTAGAVGAPGVLLLPLQREFGWSTAAISSAMADRSLLFGLMGPFAGRPGRGAAKPAG